MIMVMKIRPMTRAMIKAHAEEEAPREMCGLIVRREQGAPLAFLPTRNMSEAGDEYIVDATDHLRAIDEGHDIVGVVHSHVYNYAEPSGFDRANMIPGYLYAIYSVKHDSLRCWAKGAYDSVVEVQVIVSSP